MLSQLDIVIIGAVDLDARLMNTSCVHPNADTPTDTITDLEKFERVRNRRAAGNIFLVIDEHKICRFGGSMVKLP